MTTCARCNAPLSPARLRRHARFCTLDCSRRSYRDRYVPSLPAKAGVPAGTIGAASEMRVCADLMLRGFHVFRAMSPSCECDVAILRDGKLLRVEVKTAWQNAKTGNIFRPTTKAGAFDVLALALPDRIVYEPADF